MLAGALAPASMLLCLALPALAQEEGRIGIRLLEAPADRADDPRAQVYIVDHVAPGTSISRDIEVTSTLSDPLPVELYAAASSVEDGTWRPLDGRARNDVSQWTSVTPSETTIEPGGAATVTVRIDVPPDASEGERYAVVWAQAPASEGGDVRVINRVGIRIYLSVGPGGEPPSALEIVDLTPQRDASGRPHLDIVARNTGGRAIDVTGEARLLDGPGGATVGPVAAESGRTIGIGDEAALAVPFSTDLPDGPWNAEATLRAGDIEVVARAEVSFAPSGAAEAPVDQADDPGARSAWPVIALALLLLILVVLLLLYVLWRRRSEDDHPDGEHHDDRVEVISS